MLGEGQIYISGGCDTMSRIPYLMINHRFGARMGQDKIEDGMLYDGLVDPFMHYHMGITAENVAKKCGITREEMDEFALASHQKAEAAIKAGKFKDDIDLWELNEAFAAQSLGCIKDLGLPIEKVNVNGGAIALGHPVGATGARLVMTISAELARRGARFGVVTLCIGGGQGIATLVENVNV